MEQLDRRTKRTRQAIKSAFGALDPPIDYEIMLSYQMSATIGMIMYWAETNFKYSAAYMAEQLLTLVNARIDHVEFKQ
ncbi:TetR-like C-terminal domain-containing protein [Brevibacillus centrosporus]|uniref:TetR-like C-terminal domain-containing protein n=1 Tax=Brevibacillus centrosporus TaxID=54910 RepID=UPI002E217E09|nr:TetR-like C-terminal domain-containing protein [Brevibacillus centrosporus]